MKANIGKTFLFILLSAGAVLAQDGALDSAYDPTLTRSGVAFAKSIAALPDGKVIVGGVFSAVDGTAAGSIARLNADGSLDTTFNSGGVGFAGGTPTIYSVVRTPDGKILVGGIFTSYNGTARKNILRLNADGSLDTSFDPGTGPSNAVFTMAIQGDGKIILGGAFATYSGLAANRVARINADGTLDTSFVNTMVPQVGVLAVAIQPDGKIMIGGGWDFLNNVEWRFGLARLNADGSTDNTFIPHTNNFDLYRASVATIKVQQDGKILVGGLLRLNAAANNKNIARFNTDGTIDSSFDTGTTSIDGAVTQIIPQENGKFLVGGYFHTLNGVAHDGFGRLEANGVVDSSVTTQATPVGNPAGVDQMIQQDSGNVIMVGQFSSVNTTTRTGIARLQFAAPTHRATTCDYDGDGRTDFAIRRIVSGQFWWWIRNSGGADTVTQWGKSGDQLVCGDFDGDSKTDLTIFRNGVEGVAGFWVLRSSDSVAHFEPFGLSNDNPTIADDFDGDGKTDYAVYRNGPGAGLQSYFYYRGSLNNPTRNIAYIPWGVQFDRPYSGDFNGDGKADIGVQRTANSLGTQYIYYPSNGSMQISYIGTSADSIIPGDYDGDGKTDLAFLRNENGGRTWYVTTDLGTNFTVSRWGVNNALPVVGDYDGDGKSDIAVFQNDTNGGGWNFFIVNSSNNSTSAVRWGQNLDFPLAAYNAH